jgi:hypothetical protein
LMHILDFSVFKVKRIIVLSFSITKCSCLIGLLL